jgi:RNA polymerase sigma-70 factor (ECF subfamily)
MSRIELADPNQDTPPSSTLTSRGLLDRVKADDEAAWHRLVDLYAPLVYRWCRRSNLKEQDAADVFQDVFQAVAAHIGGFHKEKPGDTFRGWLRTITRNKLNDHFRKWGREPAGEGGTEARIRLTNLAAVVPADEDESEEAQADTSLVRRALALIRSEFEPRTWQAFWLTSVEGRTAAQVSGELNMSVGAVRVAKSRVLRRLREELGDA